MFLHADTGSPTNGCVSLPRARLDTVLRWLDPAQHPRIVIGTKVRDPQPVALNVALARDTIRVPSRPLLGFSLTSAAPAEPDVPLSRNRDFALGS